jgi:hypothetical protein
MIDFYTLIGLTVAGSVAAFFAGRLPMSSVGAVALSLVPLAGFGLTRVFC